MEGQPTTVTYRIDNPIAIGFGAILVAVALTEIAGIFLRYRLAKKELDVELKNGTTSA